MPGSGTAAVSQDDLPKVRAGHTQQWPPLPGSQPFTSRTFPALTHYRSAAPAAAPLVRTGHTSPGRPAAPVPRNGAPRLSRPRRGDPAAARRCSSRRGVGATQVAAAVSAADRAGQGERGGSPGAWAPGPPGYSSCHRDPLTPRPRGSGPRGCSGASGREVAARCHPGSADTAGAPGLGAAGRDAARWPGTPWPRPAGGGSSSRAWPTEGAAPAERAFKGPAARGRGRTGRGGAGRSPRRGRKGNTRDCGPEPRGFRSGSATRGWRRAEHPRGSARLAGRRLLRLCLQPCPVPSGRLPGCPNTGGAGSRWEGRALEPWWGPGAGASPPVSVRRPADSRAARGKLATSALPSHPCCLGCPSPKTGLRGDP